MGESWSAMRLEARRASAWLIGRRLRANVRASSPRLTTSQGGGQSIGNSVTVGPPGSNYPIESSRAEGGAAAVLNRAIAEMNSGKGGTVWILGGPGKTYWTEATVTVLAKVNLFSDGANVEPMDKATFTPIFGNDRKTGTLNNLEFFGLAFNANGQNSGFTPQPTSVTSNEKWKFPELKQQSTVLLYNAGGTIASVKINGLPVNPAGPWYVTPTDSFVATFSGAPAWTYVQNIDGWWTYNTQDCRWVACGPWGSGTTPGGYGAGCMFTLDSGEVQLSGGNWIDIFGGGGWAAGGRFNGTPGSATTENYVVTFQATRCLFRGFDIAAWGDSNHFWNLRVDINPVGPSNQFVAFWLGSAGSAEVSALTYNVTIDYLSAGNKSQPAAAYFIVLGYYNTRVVKSPSFVVRGTNHVGSGSAAYPIVTDLRFPPVPDWYLADNNLGIEYKPATGGQTADLSRRLGLNNQVAVPASGNPTAAVPYRQIFYVQSVGTVSQVLLTDPSGASKSLQPASLAVGQTIVIPPGATLTLSYSVAPSWVSYLGD